MVDSTPKRCESNGCKYAANFGNAAQRTRRFCARHKLGGMLSYQELVGALAPVGATDGLLTVEARLCGAAAIERMTCLTRQFLNKLCS